MRNSIKVYCWTIWVSKFTKSTTFLNKTFIVSLYLTGECFHRIHSAITIANVSLKEYSLNVHFLRGTFAFGTINSTF
jgi:hypothetical protein